MTTLTQTAASFPQIMAGLSRLTMAQQLSLICELVQRGPQAPYSSDAWVDAMDPVDVAFTEAYDQLDTAAEYTPCDRDVDAFWRDSIHAERAGLSEIQA